MPGERLDPVEGCVALKNVDAERQFACIEGMHIYTCPSREHACKSVDNYVRNGTATTLFHRKIVMSAIEVLSAFNAKLIILKLVMAYANHVLGKGLVEGKMLISFMG